MIQKGYYESSRWAVQIDEPKAFIHFLDRADLLNEERRLREAGSLKAAYEVLAAKPSPTNPPASGRSAKRRAIFQAI